MNEAELTEIYRKIGSGERRHGDFLTNFAKAYLYADPQNRGILKQVANELAIKYGLESYAEYEPEEVFPQLSESMASKEEMDEAVRNFARKFESKGFTVAHTTFEDHTKS